jgi:hypothetical protein
MTNFRNDVRLARLVAALLGASAIGAPAATLAADKAPIVVELFTSQGCSSCPPANANLITLSKSSNVLTLSFAVTYWDYLGWKDSFDRPEYTDRQVAYEPPLHQSGPYTPQMVINGASTVVGNDLNDVIQAVASAIPLSGPTLALANGSLSIGAATAPASGADVWLVRYDPNLVEVPVGRGENSGRTLPHIHVVHALQRVGGWTGTAVSFDIAGASDRYKTAVLVQAVNGGPILAAYTD